VVLPIYKGKGDPMECGSYRGIKLLEHAMKVVERIFEHRIRPTRVVPDQRPLNGRCCDALCTLHIFVILGKIVSCQ